MIWSVRGYDNVLPRGKGPAPRNGAYAPSEQKSCIPLKWHDEEYPLIDPVHARGRIARSGSAL